MYFHLKENCSCWFVIIQLEGQEKGDNRFQFSPLTCSPSHCQSPLLTRKNWKISFLNFLVPSLYYKYFLFPIFFSYKWSRCGAVLSYAEKYHYETDKQSGIVMGPFYMKHYLLVVFIGIVSSCSVSPFSFFNIEIPALILKFLLSWINSLKSLSY